MREPCAGAARDEALEADAGFWLRAAAACVDVAISLPFGIAAGTAAFLSPPGHAGEARAVDRSPEDGPVGRPVVTTSSSEFR